MADQVTNFSSLPLPQRWGFSFGLSLLLWVLPPTLKAPRLGVFLAFLGAVAGFGNCIVLSGDWAETDRRRRKLQLQSEELENYQLGLEEEATKRELAAMFFPVSDVSAVSETKPEIKAFPVSETPTTPPINGGGRFVSVSESETETEMKLYTAQKLTLEEAAELIAQMAQTMKQSEIIAALWRVKPGGSKAYKTALSEYRLITQ